MRNEGKQPKASNVRSAPQKEKYFFSAPEVRNEKYFSGKELNVRSAVDLC